MLKIIKKAETTPLKAVLLRLIAAIAALVVSAFVMLLIGYNPIEMYAKILEGSLATAYRMQSTINKTIPLIVLSLGVAIAFKMKFWNIGGEGQFYVGAIAATAIALKAPDMSAPILLTLMALSAICAGALWALVPGVLKAKFGTSETLVTLMMNYIALGWVTYLQYVAWKDPKYSGMPKITQFTDNAILPKVFGIHIGWIIALVLIVLVTILFKRTKLGYEISVLGENDTTAKYAGMNTIKILLLAVLLSGALSGLAGMMEASAIENSLSEKLSGGMGFTAIIIAWLAQLNPPVILIVSFIFAMLLQGGEYLQIAIGTPTAVAGILQGCILFFVLGSEFFIRYKVVRDKKTIESKE